ncbi:MAG: hypothetical protein HN417_05275 [Desulfobacula sp.]|jgi:hypothetical protein|nr:hypothetical protein [Desulfobacula sp.]
MKKIFQTIITLVAAAPIVAFPLFIALGVLIPVFHYADQKLIGPPGLIEKTKQAVLGVKYWERKLKKIDVEIANLEALYMLPADDEEITEIEHQEKQILQKLYQEYPQFAPTIEEIEAEALREKADRLEAKGINKKFKIELSKQIDALLQERKTILTKIQFSK